jgi:hypothetical protein
MKNADLTKKRNNIMIGRMILNIGTGKLKRSSSRRFQREDS